MRIAILGTRGIPNRYGGFERFAEEISKGLVKHGHSVYITKPSNLSNQFEVYPEIVTVDIGVPEFLPENLKTIVYDYLSLRWAKHNGVDAIIECGHSFAPLLLLFSSDVRKKIITNPDGLEYLRTKWGFIASLYLKTSERFAFNYSSAIVCDNRALMDYYSQKYRREMHYIPYGAHSLVHKPNINEVKHLIPDDDYYLMIARITPENNIDLILRTFQDSKRNCLVVGDIKKGYPAKLFRKYSKLHYIKFLGAIYDQTTLNALRYYSKAYLHGHSVGGTNPSLLEAMACGCYIIAHDNPFNRAVLGSEALYFHDTVSLLNRLKEFEGFPDNEVKRVKKLNLEKIQLFYSWDSVSARYNNIINQVKNRRAT